MVSKRILMFVSSFLLLFGALLVGDAFHRALVTDQNAILSLAVVIRLVFGVAAIGIGYRLRVSPEHQTTKTADCTVTNADENKSFTLENSPLGEKSMERLAEQEQEATRERKREDDQ